MQASSSRPISLPAQNDVHMASGSGSFNPASYTRQFLGSPMSYRAQTYYPSGSPGSMLFGSFEQTPKMPSSLDSDRGANSLANAVKMMERADEHCRNFTCCGLHLTDLHALVDHFEESHVVVLDPLAPHPHYPATGFDVDDMELDTPSPSFSSPSASPSPPRTPPPAVSAFDTTTVLLSRGRFPSAAYTTPTPVPMRSTTSSLAGSGMEDAFPGAARSRSRGSTPPQSTPTSPYSVAPNLVFSSTENTPASSRRASPVPQTPNTTPTIPAASSSSKASSSKPLGSGLLLSKPFRCPKPNCNKSYKQANGLKYHMTHGSCNFAPPKDLEHVQALLASKLASKGLAAAPDAVVSEEGGALRLQGLESMGISELELREVEREAERRLRPFACGIGECQRRYKNMNGLRYHYQHSGDHGAIGLTLLASGQHESLRNHAGKAARAAPRPPSSPQTPHAQGQGGQPAAFAPFPGAVFGRTQGQGGFWTTTPAQ